MHWECTCTYEKIYYGRIVAEICFRRKVGIGSRSHCLLGEACKSLAISSIGAGGNDDKTLGVRGGGGCNEVAWVTG